MDDLYARLVDDLYAKLRGVVANLPDCCVCDDLGCEFCAKVPEQEWPEYAARMDMVNYEDRSAT